MQERVLILGMGMSGKAALKKLLNKGFTHFLIIDKQRPEEGFEPANVVFLFDSSALTAADFHGVSRCILSPGVGPSSPAYQLVHRLGLSVTGEMELGLEDLRGRKVVVTGSNGKSTCVTLAAHLLTEAGYKAHAVGNVGLALSGIENSRDEDIWIVEASSYQLETLNKSYFELGVVLNITENHLDRYGSMELYAKAKALIQRGLLPGASLWINETSHRQFDHLWHHLPIELWDTAEFWSQFSMRAGQGKSLDKLIAAKLQNYYKSELSHDVENVKVALAICEKLGLCLEEALEGLGTYQKLPHRLERVDEIRGIEFINDSKSTSVAATEHALSAVKGPLVLIAGGVHKGASYTPWSSGLRAKGIAVCVIGQAAAQISSDLEGVRPVHTCSSLQEAVATAWHLLESGGGSVLFSPGCSSFDMFTNFEDRGRKFKECIQELKARGAR